MPEGHIGNARTAGRRLGVPDWVRAQAGESSGSTRASTTNSTVVIDIPVSDATANSAVPQSFNLSLAQGRNGVGTGESESPVLTTVHRAVGEAGIGNTDIPLVETVHDADSGTANARGSLPRVRVRTAVVTATTPGEGSISDSELIADAGDSRAVAQSDSPVSTIVHDATDARTEATGSISITTWVAGLGGVVEDPNGTPVEGAEVHIIRDNDDTKVATTTTDSNGRWHVGVRGGKTTEADPPVYVIDAYYRDGPKRDTAATVFNATNRPYIDTADPSETDPYTDPFYYKDGSI